jgi:hypothetical protein
MELYGSISEAEHNRVKFLTLIKRVDERIAQRLDKRKPLDVYGLFYYGVLH